MGHLQLAARKAALRIVGSARVADSALRKRALLADSGPAKWAGLTKEGELMIFRLDPYKAIGDVQFGMSGTALTTKVGVAKRVTENALGDMEYQYEGFTFRLRNDSVVEASFLPACEVIASGSDVFSDPNAFDHLVAVDGDPREFVGFIILYRGSRSQGFTMRMNRRRQ
ncbi:hypothetical protein ACFW0P_16745 [Lysobacter soli]|uniref:hypothetical protein n=1 Tax=Lysobacter soli TaxID=453783 RepID=UPI00368ADD81